MSTHCTVTYAKPPSRAFNQDEWTAYWVFPPPLSNPLLPAPVYRLSHWFDLAASLALIPHWHFRRHAPPPVLITLLNGSCSRNNKCGVCLQSQGKNVWDFLQEGSGRMWLDHRLLHWLRFPAPIALHIWVGGCTVTHTCYTLPPEILISWSYLDRNPRKPGLSAFYNYLGSRQNSL